MAFLRDWWMRRHCKKVVIEEKQSILKLMLMASTLEKL